MTTIKTSELTGTALDWAVAKCEGGTDFMHDGISMHFVLHGMTKVLATGWAPSMSYTPSTNWMQGGSIIEREGISINSHLDGHEWFARDYWGANEQAAETPLVAAMRCYVTNKLGDNVDVPDELA